MEAARSPSPVLSRPSNRSPNSAENSGALGKCGSFRLSKPCKASENPRKSPVSKSAVALPSLRASFEQKENEGEPNFSKQARTRAPALNTSKSMKSFMAPTISAASKVTAASPRKKILAERNQTVRGSSEGISVPTEGMKTEEMKQKSEICVDSEEISGQNLPRKLDFSSGKDHHQLTASSPQDIALLDADPCLRPYDPLENYTSPRPLFRLYKPNPRIEQHKLMKDLLHPEDAMHLEDIFSPSDNSEDAEDCSDTDEDATLMMEPEAQTKVSKPIPRSFGTPKLILFVLVLTVVSFFIPLTDSPVLTPFMIKEGSFIGPPVLPFRVLQGIHFYDYLDATSKSLQTLATRMRQWSINSFVILTSFGSFPNELVTTPHYFNMTISSTSVVQSADLGLCYDSNFELAENIINGPNEVDNMEVESQLEISDLDFCYTSSFELEEKKNIINGKNEGDNVEIELRLENTDLEEVIADNSGDAAEKKNIINAPNEAMEIELQLENADLEEALADSDRYSAEKIETDFFDEEPKYPKIVKFDTMGKNEQPEKIESAISKEEYPNLEEQVLKVYQNVEEQVLLGLGKGQSSQLNKIAIDSSVAYPIIELQMTKKKDFGAVLLKHFSELHNFISSERNLILGVLGIFATTSFFFLVTKRRQPIPSTGNNPSPPCEKPKLGSSDEPNSCLHANRDLYEHVEMVSDSGPTEMSSSFKHSLQRYDIGCFPVTPSPEVVQTRRESGVSSSMSYGSFTSFERRSRSAKKGFQEDEVMTPVRRSSRIRNQVSCTP